MLSLVRHPGSTGEFIPVDTEDEYDIADKQRTEDESNETKQSQPSYHSDDSDNRMYISQFFQNGDPGDIVDIACYNYTIQ